ncbi:FAD-dependent oxidoreductase [Dactylosporangium sp. NPDC000521]|uniref:FAD-dependent oxidoreductase n=1 Tax=Dactylosporangium sp. NPDC000521 TaxID=3363975 RepID=UPI00368DC09A
MTGSGADVVVVGAGVTGLTTAVLLAERGMSVVIVSRDHPSRTTSCAAGALWGPHLVEHECVERWGKHTLEMLTSLATEPATGVELMDGVEACRTPQAPSPYLAWLPGVRTCGPEDLRPGFTMGWRYRIPVVDMPVYLAYLFGRLQRAGGVFWLRDVPALENLGDEAGIVVNCTGHGAGRLTADDELTGARGEVVIVDNPGLDEFFIEVDSEDPDLTYFVPQGDHVVLGGTAYPGRADTEPDPRAAREIVRRCAKVEPRLAGAVIREVRVGVRPFRRQVRLEHVNLGRCHVVHNYGHGGGGVSLSWGCALETVELVTALESSAR